MRHRLFMALLMFVLAGAAIAEDGKQLWKQYPQPVGRVTPLLRDILKLPIHYPVWSGFFHGFRAIVDVRASVDECLA